MPSSTERIRAMANAFRNSLRSPGEDRWKAAAGYGPRQGCRGPGSGCPRFAGEYSPQSGARIAAGSVLREEGRFSLWAKGCAEGKDLETATGTGKVKVVTRGKKYCDSYQGMPSGMP